MNLILYIIIQKQRKNRTYNPLDVVCDIGLARAESIIFQTSKDYKIRSSRLSL